MNTYKHPSQIYMLYMGRYLLVDLYFKIHKINMKNF